MYNVKGIPYDIVRNKRIMFSWIIKVCYKNMFTKMDKYCNQIFQNEPNENRKHERTP